MDVPRSKLLDDEYSPLRCWIRSARSRNLSWEEIQRQMNDTDFFKNNASVNFWPDDSQDVWPDLVNEMENQDKARQKTRDDVRKGIICSRNEVNGLDIPSGEDSCWQQYRKRLHDKGIDDRSIQRMEEECLSILQRISLETEPDAPVKGLVVGNVQSGKTSNMAGVMAMAADYGWNLFIVLSGVVNNLNNQTRERLSHDLKGDFEQSLFWEFIDVKETKPSQCSFSEQSNHRYVIVTIKQKDRLIRILNWLNKDSKTKCQMKVLLIDDEADLASANSVDLKEEERRTINNLVVNTVNCRTRAGDKADRYGSMNYISYTATPYANFLSDSSIEGLYPSNFVVLLTPSNQYIGPREIFGYKEYYPGMNIIRYGAKDGIPEDDIRPVHRDCKNKLPDGLKKAISWFICCVAALRYRGRKNPKTMLIHTSYKTQEHTNVARAVSQYLKCSKNEIKNLCRGVYQDEIKYDLEQFQWDVQDYGNIGGIEPYPLFGEIAPLIDEILEHGTSQLYQIDDCIQYTKGINLCIDNSTDTVIDDCDKDYHPRLIYPEKDDPEYDEGLAFIVIGGNTISRGLTLDGLCSTYFARTSQQGDTLMQMSRWFGYRKGYELYPRVWMSQKSYDDFCNLVEIEEDLRDFIRRNYSRYSPKDYPPMIRKFPPTGRIKRMTSKDKAATDVVDFRGTLTEVTVFDRENDVIAHNEEVTYEFLEDLDRYQKSTAGYGRSAKVWRNVSEDIVGSYLHKIDICKHARNSSELDQLAKWTDEKIVYGWNVVLAGVSTEEDNGLWGPEGSKVIRVQRSRKELKYDDGLIHIASLSDPRDRYTDIDADKISELPEDQTNSFNEYKKSSATSWGDIRNLESLGVCDVPLLMIYPIRGDSSYNGKASGRAPLGCNFDQTIIGIAIIVPGRFDKRGSSALYQTIRREVSDGSGDFID